MEHDQSKCNLITSDEDETTRFQLNRQSGASSRMFRATAIVLKMLACGSNEPNSALRWLKAGEVIMTPCRTRRASTAAIQPRRDAPIGGTPCRYLTTPVVRKIVTPSYHRYDLPTPAPKDSCHSR